MHLTGLFEADLTGAISDRGKVADRGKSEQVQTNLRGPEMFRSNGQVTLVWAQLSDANLCNTIVSNSGC